MRYWTSASEHQRLLPVDLEPDLRSANAPEKWETSDRLSEGRSPSADESSARPKKRKRRLWQLAILLVIGAGALFWSVSVPDSGGSSGDRGGRLVASSGPTQSAEAPPTPPRNAVPVTAARAERKDIAIFRTGLGSVQAFNTVSVTSRVDGQLQEIQFEEGQEVKAGDVLARIDDRLYQAAVRQREAQLRASTAQVNSARADMERLKTLLNRDVGSRQAYEAQVALVEQNEAQRDAASADLDNARLQLEYATIRSPIDGRVGFRQIDVGNMIAAAERAPIATVTQMQPVNIVFTLPQEDLLAVGSQLDAGEALPVSALARDGRLDLGQGELSTIDNQVDSTTGTFKLKARFDNEQKTLWPGEFVTVRLMVEKENGALVVPAQAVQRSQQGTYVYVVGTDDIAQMRDVQVGLIQDGLAIIKSGLEDGEQVVVDGQFKLEPGSLVSTTPAAAPAAMSDATTNQSPG